MSSQPRSARSSELLDSVNEQLRQWLYRPIVFHEPERNVAPASWIEHTPFAFWLVDALRPATFVELGTHRGISYAAFAQAIARLGLNTAAYAVDTWKGDPHAGFYDESVFEEWSTYHDRHFSAFSRLVRSTFDEAAEHFADGSIDLLHIDGWHTYEAVSADYQRWQPKMSTRGVIVLHDINVREGDFGAWRVWEELRRRHRSFAFLHGHGLGVLGLGSELPGALEWLLSRRDEVEIVEIQRFFAGLGRHHSQVFAQGDLRQRLVRLEADLAASQQAVADLTRVRDAGENQLSAVERQRDAVSRQASLLEAQLQASTSELARASDQLQQQQRRLDRLQLRVTRLSALVAGSRPAGASQSPVPAAKPSPIRSLARRLFRGARRVLSFPYALGMLPSRRQRLTPSSLTLLRRPASLRDAWTVHRSGLFDVGFYLGRYPDVGNARMAPLCHFVLKGAAEDRDPHPLFDTSFYLSANADVAAAAVNPLAHYLRRGAREGRAPHPLFDPSYYLDKNPQLRDELSDPLVHFLDTGAHQGCRPNPLFDCAYYLQHSPDVAASGTNPLVHYAHDGWREGRRPSLDFDPAYYTAHLPEVQRVGLEPLAHYLQVGIHEGRAPVDPATAGSASFVVPANGEPPVALRTRSLGPARPYTPTVVCLTHVVPLHPRAGNEYRIHRMLRHLKAQGYRVVPIVAPLSGEPVDAAVVPALAEIFANAVLCHRDGQIDHILTDIPDVLSSLDDEVTPPYAEILDEAGRNPHLLSIDREFCHDVVVATVLRLNQVLGPYVLLCEYLWMSRVLPLVHGQVVKVIDTHDVFSTKFEKVMRYGISDLHVSAEEEATRLGRADLVVAIQPEEARELRRLLPAGKVVTAGVDVDLVDSGPVPQSHRLLYVASNNSINRRAIEDFFRFAWPDIRLAVPAAELLVVGRVGEAIAALPEGVTAVGPVDDLKPLYAGARLVINPAVGGTGLKVKTLEALGHLRPVVCWPSGAEGLPPQLSALCVTVRDWYDFARQVIRLLEQPPSAGPALERHRLETLLSAAEVYAPLDEALGNALASVAAGPSPGRRPRP